MDIYISFQGNKMEFVSRDETSEDSSQTYNLYFAFFSSNE